MTLTTGHRNAALLLLQRNVFRMMSSDQGADINSTDYRGNSPLLLATNCGAWKTVGLLLSKGGCPEASCCCCGGGSVLMLLWCSGASVNVKDTCGCNFLHLAILQPKGLKNIPEEVLQVCPSYELSNFLLLKKNKTCY